MLVTKYLHIVRKNNLVGSFFITQMKFCLIGNGEFETCRTTQLSNCFLLCLPKAKKRGREERAENLILKFVCKSSLLGNHLFDSRLCLILLLFTYTLLYLHYSEEFNL